MALAAFCLLSAVAATVSARPVQEAGQPPEASRPCRRSDTAVEGMSPDTARHYRTRCGAGQTNIPAFTTSGNRQSLVLGGRCQRTGHHTANRPAPAKEDMSAAKSFGSTAAPSERTEEFMSIAARTAAAIAVLIQRPAPGSHHHLKKALHSRFQPPRDVLRPAR